MSKFFLLFLGFQLWSVAASALEAPSNVSAQALSSSQIRIDFKDNSSDEVGFVVQRSRHPERGFSAVARLGKDTTSYVSKYLPAGRTFYFRVRAIGKRTSTGMVKSLYSNIASAKTLAQTPAPPKPAPDPTPAPPKPAPAPTPAPPKPAPAPTPAPPKPAPVPTPAPPKPAPAPTPAPPKPAPVPPSVSCGTMSREECEVLGLVNKERSKDGLASLKALNKCNKAATSHAQDMATNNYFSHNGLNETWSARMQRFGLSGTYVGENIAAGQSTPAAVMDSWMNSSGHRANILNSNFKSMGVAVASDKAGRKIWVQCFSGLPGDVTNETPAPAPTPAPPKPAPAPPKPAPAPVPSSCGIMSAVECEVLNLVNEERAKDGLGSLKILNKCVEAARYHAQDMADNNYFAHDGLTESWAARMQRFGLWGDAVGENIAYGQTSPAQVMSAWMNSPGHRANILDSGYNSMGVGVVSDKAGRKLWVQCFSGFPGL